MRKQLAQLEKTTGKKPSRLKEGPVLDKEFAYIWFLFTSIYSGSLLTYSELKAYSDLTGVRLSFVEIETLREMSAIYDN